MSAWILDNFVAGSYPTALIGHVPTIGSAWASTGFAQGGDTASTTPATLVAAGQLQQSGAVNGASALDYPSIVLPADISVSATWFLPAGSTDVVSVNGVTGLAARMGTAPNYDRYVFRYAGHTTAGSRQWSLDKVLGGATSPTNLASLVEDLNAAVNHSYVLELRCIGTTIQGWANGVLKCSATDSSLTGSGYAGLTAPGNASGTQPYVSQFKAQSAYEGIEYGGGYGS